MPWRILGIGSGEGRQPDGGCHKRTLSLEDTWEPGEAGITMDSLGRLNLGDLQGEAWSRSGGDLLLME